MPGGHLGPDAGLAAGYHGKTETDHVDTFVEQVVRDRIQNARIHITEAGQSVAWRGSADGSTLTFFGLARKSLFTTERIYRLTLEDGQTIVRLQYVWDFYDGILVSQRRRPPS